MKIKFEEIKMSVFATRHNEIIVIGEINTITVEKMTPEEAMLELMQKNHDDYPLEMILNK